MPGAFFEGTEIKMLLTDNFVDKLQNWRFKVSFPAGSAVKFFMFPVIFLQVVRNYRDFSLPVCINLNQIISGVLQDEYILQLYSY
jgi:hypothetical protein